MRVEYEVSVFKKVFPKEVEIQPKRYFVFEAKWS